MGKFTIYAFVGIVAVILAVDFYKRYKQSNEGWKFLLKHWYEIPAMMPMFALALVETPLAIWAAVQMLRMFRIIHLFFRATSIFEGSKFCEIIVFAGGVIIIGGIAGFIAEAGVPETKMPTLGDALWWSVVTVAMVGYGDIVPVAAEGRIVGVFLMITGVATFAMVTSRLGAAFLQSKGKKKGLTVTTSFSDETRDLIKRKINDVEKLDEKEVDTLTAMIKALWPDRRKINLLRADVKRQRVLLHQRRRAVQRTPDENLCRVAALLVRKPRYGPVDRLFRLQGSKRKQHRLGDSLFV